MTYYIIYSRIGSKIDFRNDSIFGMFIDAKSYDDAFNKFNKKYGTECIMLSIRLVK